MARHKIPLRKKLRVLAQLLILAAAAAWVTHVVIERGTPKEYDKQLWTQRNGFVAISYGGLSRTDKGPHLSRENFQKHLEALAENGFIPVTTEDIEAFYRDGAPLPDRAVYIMFEGGRKDSAIFGQESLIQTGMRATMFISPGLLSQWNRTFLKKSQIGTLGKSRYWGVGSSGYHVYMDNPDKQASSRKYYLTDYLRDENGARIETLSKYRERARYDYEESITSLEKLVKRKPNPYLFIPANTLNNSMPRELSAVNRKLLDENFSLAFTREGIAYNSEGDDPHKLTRLLVKPSMTPEMLVSSLASWLPNFTPYRFSDKATLERWHTNHGKVESDGVSLTLQGDLKKNGFVWLIGSDNWRNIELSTELHIPDDGEQSVYLRYKDRESFIRLAFRSGQARVQERIRNQGLSTLATIATPSGQPLDIQVRLIHNRLALSINGVDSFPNPLALMSDEPGIMALGINPLHTGDAPSQPSDTETILAGVFDRVTVTPLQETILSVRTANDVAKAKMSPGNSYSAILTDLSSLTIDESLTAMLLYAADSGWERLVLLPRGRMDKEKLNHDLPDLPEGLTGGLWSGVVLSPPSGAKTPDVSHDAEVFREKELRVGLQLDAAQAKQLAQDNATTLPIDFLMLPRGLDETIMIPLKRRYPELFFESENALFRKGK